MAEITLIEAKKFYNSSEETKEFLLTKFSKEELEGKTIPTQEEFDKFCEENIFSQIDYSKMHFLTTNENISKMPTSRIELRNSKDEYIFEYNYDQENQYFKYSYGVYLILMNKFSLQDLDLNKCMKSMLETRFNLFKCQPQPKRQDHPDYWCLGNFSTIS